VVTLRFLSGPLAGTERRFDGEIVLGREAEVDVDDAEVSRRHVRLAAVEHGVLVEDLDSSNGVWIGDERVDGSAVISVATTIRIGRTRLELEPPERWTAETRISVAATAADTVISAAVSPAEDDIRVPAGPGSADADARVPAGPGPVAPETTDHAAIALAAAPPATAAVAPKPARAAVPASAPRAVPLAPGEGPIAPFGAYVATAAIRGRRGPATRLLVPAAAAAIVIVATAIALVVYFASR
jgi:pSer/pThr/pTyr-binding forkhead associated (FHA) protein